MRNIYIYAYTHPFVHIGKDILENLVSENIHEFHVGFLQIGLFLFTLSPLSDLSLHSNPE